MMLNKKSTAAIMLDLAEAVEAYVTQTLHTTVELKLWPAAVELAPYLRTAYGYMRGEVGETPVLWLLAGEPVAPKTLKKHIDALTPHWAGATVAVFPSLPSYVRQRLIQRGIAFVVPGTQLYLPDFGFDFCERAAAQQQPLQREYLRPSAQLLLLHLLYREARERFIASDVAPVLGYTPMTMSRAVAELEAVGLVEASKVGRAKVFHLAGSPGDTWGAAQEHLRTPVMRRIVLPPAEWGDVSRPLAGLSALAEYTMLAAPKAPVQAIAVTHTREIEAANRTTGDLWATIAREDNEEQTEVWSYDPNVLHDALVVDRLSLYLSLRDDTDERVQSALSELLEGMEW